ncbi:MAG: hypothetical protein EA422_11100 [Gemmatimonadales bacterium]|nr:MAG: hypothetical protein EA422_11100 [Gemmatimonadales bacterium]
MQAGSGMEPRCGRAGRQGMPDRFPSWHFPPGAVPTPGYEPLDDLDVAILDPDQVDHLLDILEASAVELRKIPALERARRLGAVGRRLGDRGDPLRREAEERLPHQAGLSPAVARQLLDRMSGQWTPEALERLVHVEFSDPAVLDGFRLRPGAGDRVCAVGDRLALHVGSGNVPGVGVTSVLRSLLVGTPVLLKPGRGDVVLPVLAARALAGAFPEGAGALAVAYWPGRAIPELETRAFERARRVVVYGGMEVVRSIRERLPAHTPLVAYHHRVSAAAVAREILAGEGEAEEVARAAASAVAAYDQQGCVSPHIFWVERGGSVSPEAWARLLARELEALQRTLPARPTAELSARIQTVRGEAEMDRALGADTLVLAPGGTDWTVICESGFAFGGACGGRTARVQAMDRLDALAGSLTPWEGILQSVALECPEPRRTELARSLAQVGVSRITTLEHQPWPAPWWLHDGSGPLRALVGWVSLEMPEPSPPSC